MALNVANFSETRFLSIHSELFTKFFNNFNPILKRFLGWRLRKKQHFIDDIIQDTMLAVWNKFVPDSRYGEMNLQLERYTIAVAKKYVLVYTNPESRANKLVAFDFVEFPDFAADNYDHEASHVKEIKDQFLLCQLEKLSKEDLAVALSFFGNQFSKSEVLLKTGLGHHQLHRKIRGLIEGFRSNIKQYDLKELLVLSHQMRDSEMESLYDNAFGCFDLQESFQYAFRFLSSNNNKRSISSYKARCKSFVSVTKRYNLDLPISSYLVDDFYNLIDVYCKEYSHEIHQKSCLRIIKKLFDILVIKEKIKENLFYEAYCKYFNIQAKTHILRDDHKIRKIGEWILSNKSQNEINQKAAEVWNASPNIIARWIVYACEMLKVNDANVPLVEKYILSTKTGPRKNTLKHKKRTSNAVITERIGVLTKWLELGIYSSSDRKTILSKISIHFSVCLPTAKNYLLRSLKVLNNEMLNQKFLSKSTNVFLNSNSSRIDLPDDILEQINEISKNKAYKGGLQRFIAAKFNMKHSSAGYYIAKAKLAKTTISTHQKATA